MVTVTIAIAAVIGATIAIFVDRNMQAKKKLEKTVGTPESNEEAAQTEAGKDQSQPGRLQNYVSSVRNRLPGGKKYETAKQFQAFADATFEDTQLKAWLTGLSPEAANALVEQLADFCYNLGFELQWLLDDTMNHDPEIKQEAITVVTAYCRACWNAAQSYSDFELFKLLKEIEQAPFARKHQDLGRRLFAELVRRDMAASVPTELFLASEKERQEHMARAIQQAAESNRDAFKTVLKDVMAAQADTSATADSASDYRSTVADKAEAESANQRRMFGKGGKGKGRSTAATPADDTPAEATPGSVAPEPSAS